MQVLTTILYILLFLFFLSVLIIIHELGHLAAAKAFNVYCLEYSIGMGPLLFKHKRKNGETQFSLRAIPFGGYVSMYGEGVTLPEGVEVDESRSLNGVKAWKRAIILLAGVTMNAVLALVFFFVSNCFPQEALYRNSVNVASESAASLAGIEDGMIFKITPLTYTDTIANQEKSVYLLDKETTVNDDETTKYATILNYETLSNFKERELANYIFVYPLEGEEIAFSKMVDPKTINYVNIHFTSQVRGENGLEDSTIYTIKVNVKDGKYEPFGCSIYYEKWTNDFGGIVKNTFTDFGNCSVVLFQAIGDLFTKPSSWSQVGGIIAVGFETTSVLQNFGFGKFLFYWGFISVNLAIFNLLPFPGLDGWQLLVLIVESTTRKKIPEKVKNIVSLIGIGLLLLLMAVIVVKDLIKYIFMGALRLL